MASGSLPFGLSQALGVLLRPFEPYLAPLWAACLSLLRLTSARIVRLVTGKGPVERICLDGWHSSRMTKRLARYLRLSPQHAALCPSLFGSKPMDEKAIMHAIIKAEGLAGGEREQHLTVSSLSQCLSCMQCGNAVLAHALQLKDTPFDDRNPSHEALLEELWSLLKPNVTRQGGRRTKEWGEIGFQGEDPATDFRGMGLLGLHQLVAFAKDKGEEARAVLLDSHHPRRFYPFAATGINITRFVLSLLEERLLDPQLYEAFEKGFEHQDPGTKDSLMMDRGMAVLHHNYANVFLEFDRRWREADPPNIMAFSKIYGPLTEDYRRQLIHTRGDLDFVSALQGY